MRHVLFNTATEKVEAVQDMSISEAEERNDKLRQLGEPQRWVPDEEGEYQ